MRRSSSVRGCFTLIELLVVVAIIAVLVAILLPGLQRARDMGRSASCMSQEKQMGTAFQMYLSDNESTYPVAFKKSSTGDADAGWTWREAIFDYLGLGKMATLGSWASAASQDVTIYTCPSDINNPSTSYEKHRTSYACNSHQNPTTLNIDGVLSFDYWDVILNPGQYAPAIADENDTRKGYRKESYVSDPSGTFIVTDNCSPLATYGWRNLNNSYMVCMYYGDMAYFTFIHNGGNNYLFCDGHVASVAAEDTCNNIKKIENGIWTPWAD